MQNSSILRLLAAIGLMGPVFAGPASAQEGAFMKDILGNLGIIQPDRAPIDYRERPPLVVPPRLDLPPPAARNVEARNPQWPNDPDVAMQRRREAEARVPTTEKESRRALENNPNLSIYEIRAGRRPGAEIPTGPVVRRGDSARDELILSPDEMRSTRRDREATLVPGQEPPRRTLTEPPSGFRKPVAGFIGDGRAEPVVRQDEADPKAFIREQQRRR